MSDFEGTVLVLGANGETGRRVVRNLREKGIPVRAMVRSEDRIATTPELSLSGVEVLIGSPLNSEDLRRATRGVRAAIGALGSRIHYSDEEIAQVEALAPTYLAAAALENRLQQLVLCSSLGTETPDAYPFLARILRQKRLGELAIIQSGIPYTIVRPSGLTNAPASGKIVLAAKLTTFGMISREDVAEVLAQALLQPQARCKVIEITSRADGEPIEPEKLFAALAD